MNLRLNSTESIIIGRINMYYQTDNEINILPLKLNPILQRILPDCIQEIINYSFFTPFNFRWRHSRVCNQCSRCRINLITLSWFVI